MMFCRLRLFAIMHTLGGVTVAMQSPPFIMTEDKIESVVVALQDDLSSIMGGIEEPLPRTEFEHVMQNIIDIVNMRLSGRINDAYIHNVSRFIGSAKESLQSDICESPTDIVKLEGQSFTREQIERDVQTLRDSIGKFASKREAVEGLKYVLLSGSEFIPTNVYIIQSDVDVTVVLEERIRQLRDEMIVSNIEEDGADYVQALENDLKVLDASRNMFHSVEQARIELEDKLGLGYDFFPKTLDKVLEERIASLQGALSDSLYFKKRIAGHMLWFMIMVEKAIVSNDHQAASELLEYCRGNLEKPQQFNSTD